MTLPPGYTCYVCGEPGADSTKGRCAPCDGSWQRMIFDLKVAGLHYTFYHAMKWAAERVREIERAKSNAAVCLHPDALIGTDGGSLICAYKTDRDYFKGIVEKEQAEERRMREFMEKETDFDELARQAEWIKGWARAGWILFHTDWEVQRASVWTEQPKVPEHLLEILPDWLKED